MPAKTSRRSGRPATRKPAPKTVPKAAATRSRQAPPPRAPRKPAPATSTTAAARGGGKPPAQAATRRAGKRPSRAVARPAPAPGLHLPRIPSLAELMPASDAAVRRATGKGWGEWLAVLDKLGARDLPHKAIAQLLSVRLGVPDWWSQMVTVGYERALGRRAVNQKAGGFAATVTRTISAAAEKAFDAWIDPELRKRWLPEPVAVRTARRPRSLRISWSDGARTVAVFITAAGERKSRVQVEQGRLRSPKEVAQAKDVWTSRLEALAHLLGR